MHHQTINKRKTFSMACAKGKRGQTLTFTERKAVLDVLENFQLSMKKSKAVEACSEATGRSPRIIYKLAKDRQRGTLKGPKRFKTPHVKSHMRIMKYKSDIRSCIRRIIHNFFVKNVPPVLNRIVDTLNAVKQFPEIKRGTLYNLLKDIGFEYERRGGKGIFVERKDIVTYRHNYLQKIKMAREQNKAIIYTGEVCLDIENILENSKVKENTTEEKSNSEIDPALVLIHAGCVQGFIEDAKLTLLCKTGRAELDSETYENWFFSQLLPNCPKNSVIVMDDAIYNSQKVGNIPNSTWSKDDIIEWFENTEIEVDYALSVSELLIIVNGIKDDYDDFKIDSKCEELGFQVLRLPPHHRELNPIYMVWDQIQHFIRSNNSSCKQEDVLQLVNNAYSNVTPDDWLNYVTEVKENEDFLWEVDCLQENVDSLIAKLK